MEPIESGLANWSDIVIWLQRQLQNLKLQSLIKSSPNAADDPPFPTLPALQFLSQQFNLTLFEQKVLLLATAVEVAPELGKVYAQAQGHPTMTYPTFGLAFRMFADASWDALAPDQALRYWQLVQVVQSVERPLITSPIKTDERITNLLLGQGNRLDYRVRPFVLPMLVDEEEISLSPSEERGLAKMSDCLAEARGNGRRVLQLTGPDTVSKKQIARRFANQQQLNLYSLTVHLLPRTAQEVSELARLWHREGLLLPLALYVDTQMLTSEKSSQELFSLLRHFLGQSDGLFLVDTNEVWRDLGRQYEVIEIENSE